MKLGINVDRRVHRSQPHILGYYDAPADFLVSENGLPSIW